MIKIPCIFFLLFFVLSFIFVNNVMSDEINPISYDSPIKETFEKKVIIWNFDDFRIGDAFSLRGARFISMTENVTKYGGYVGWGFIPGADETRSYPPNQNVTYKKENVDRINVLNSDEHVFLFYHDWDHNWYIDGYKSPWLQNLSFQKQAMDHVVWTFYNNFKYNLSFFLGGGSLCNYNTTAILAEKNIILLWGKVYTNEVAEGCRYLSVLDNELFVGAKYMDVIEGIDSWKNNFTKLYDKYYIIRVACHPFEFNATTLTYWAEFTDWIYYNHDLVNMNYTNAYNYKHDFESIQLNKYNDTFYRLSFKDAFNPLDIKWSLPGNWIIEYTSNNTKYKDLNVSSISESFKIEPGLEYNIKRVSHSINSNKEKNKDSTPGFESIFVIYALILFLFIKTRKNFNN